MSRLSDITNAAIKTLLGTFCVSKITLAINGAGAATVKNTGAIVTMINGVFYTAAALAAQSIAVTSGLSYVQPAGTTAYLTLGINAAGTVSVTQGSYAGQKLSGDPTVGLGVSQMGASWVGDGSIPDVPAGYAPIGVIKIVTDATHTFTPGTTALDAAGITATYFDIGILPDGKL